MYVPVTSSPTENILTASPTINSNNDIMTTSTQCTLNLPFVITPDISLPTGNWSTFGTTCDRVCMGMRHCSLEWNKAFVWIFQP